MLVNILKVLPECIAVPKVFKLNECVLSVSLDDRFHELFKKVVVLLTGDASLPQTDVVDVSQEGLVIRPNVECDRKSLEIQPELKPLKITILYNYQMKDENRKLQSLLDHEVSLLYRPGVA